MDALEKFQRTLGIKRELALDKPKRSKSKDKTGIFVTTEQVTIADVHKEEYLNSVNPSTEANLTASERQKETAETMDSTNPFHNYEEDIELSPEEPKIIPSRPTSAQSLAYGGNPSYLFEDPTIDATVSNPWGRFMFPRHMSDVLERKKKIDLEEARNYCREFNTTVTVTRADLETTINQRATDIAQELFSKMMIAEHRGEAEREQKRAAARHFSPYLTQAGIKVPTYFSENPTLTTDGKANAAYKTFPSKYLFSGKKGPSIEDFLDDCNRAQEYLRLSRPEFEGIFLRCMMGEPQTATRTAFRLGHTIEQVYKSLYMAYNNQITPDEANTKLANLKAPKNLTLPRLITTIQNLAGRATANYVIQTEKDNVYNTICIDALKRSLPETSQNIVSSNQVRVTTDIGRGLDFLELTMILYPHTKAINMDIERNGVSNTYNGNLSIYTTGSHQEDKEDKNNKNNNKSNGSNSKKFNPSGSVNEISAQPANEAQKDSSNYKNNKGRHHQNNQSNNKKDNNKDYHIQTGSSNKKYCSACSQNNHNNSDGCKLLRDDFGRVIPQGATSGYCDPCFKKFGKQLLHSEELCPGRPAMMKLYKENKCRPAGLYKKAYNDWLATQPDNNTNQPSGRVNMIQFTYNIGQASILAVDNTGLEAHTMTRKMYLTLEAARFNLPGEFQITGLYDTAADHSLISRSYFAAVFNVPYDDVDQHLDPSSMNLSSYSGHKIAVSGEVTLLIKLTTDSPHRPIKFAVVSDKQTKVTPLIFGMTAIRQLQLSLSFNEEEPESPPFVYTQFKPGHPLNSAYLSDIERQTASNQDVKLAPGESKFITVQIPHNFGIHPEMETIFTDDNISNTFNQGIKVFPTKSELKLTKNHTLYGYVYVTNLTNKPINSGLVVAYFEPASLYNINSVDYNFPQHQQIIHEISLIHEPSYHTTGPTSAKSTKFGTVNRVHLDISSVPVYTHIQTANNIVNLIQKTFPEQDGYIANPDAINNDVPVPDQSLSDMRSSIDDILQPAED